MDILKYYDKNLSKINNNIKNILLVLVIFFLGFFVGYVVGGGEILNSTHNQSNTVVQGEIY